MIKTLWCCFPKRKMSSIMCGPCQLGKQTRTTHQATLTTTTSRPLELLHVDLIGPTRIESLEGKRYIMVVVDDFTRFTWAILLKSKSKAPQQIEILCKRLQNEKGIRINRLQSVTKKSLRTLYWNNFASKLG